jgi:hypothetical protein
MLALVANASVGAVYDRPYFQLDFVSLEDVQLVWNEIHRSKQVTALQQRNGSISGNTKLQDDLDHCGDQSLKDIG